MTNINSIEVQGCGLAYGAALSAAQRRWSPIPVPSAKKAPVLKEWQSLRLTEDTVSKYFNGEPQNLGILLGDASNGLIDIDLDCAQAMALAATFLPPTGLIFGRTSKPASHYEYQVTEGIDTKKFLEPGGSMLVELRANGCQTIFPPSTHPSGEQVRHDSAEEPALVEGEVLRTAVARLAAAALLARHWPNRGARQHTALALGGALLRDGWSLDAAATFVGAIASAAADEEADVRAATVRQSEKQLKAEEFVTGWPTLETLIRRDVVTKAKEWLVGARQDGVPSCGGTDRGLIKDIADEILATEHFCQDPDGLLYRFSGGVYRPHADAYIRCRFKEILEARQDTKHWSSHRAREVVEYIGVDTAALWSCPPLDVINLKNGLLDITRRELSPHSPAHRSRIQLPVEFRPECTCPRTNAFVEAVFPSDCPQLYFDFIAWLMRPDVSQKKAGLLIGEGDNGKSTLMRAVLAFLGKENAANLSLQTLEKDKFAVARLVGMLANICSDLPSDHLVSTSIFKAIVGNDRLTVERKFRDSFECELFARLLFSSNQHPRSRDGSQAFFGRWVVVPFERTFAKHEQRRPRDLDAELADPSELSGVLNRALDTLPRLTTHGFTQSETTSAAWMEFREQTDPVATWLGLHTVTGAEAMVSKKDLLIRYNADAVDEDRPTMTPHAFGRAVKRLRPTITEAQRTMCGSVQWVWVGLSLREGEAVQEHA